VRLRKKIVSWISKKRTMLKLHDFYRRYANVPLNRRFVALIIQNPTPVNIFQVYKELEQVRHQQRFFAKREEELLRLAEETISQVEENEHI
jgi:uncharacterized protein YjiS (DUF1127 family)